MLSWNGKGPWTREPHRTLTSTWYKKLQPVEGLLKGGSQPVRIGKKTLYEERKLRGTSSSISNNQDALSGGTKVKPRKSKSRYSKPSILPTLLHGIFCQSGGEIPSKVIHVVHLRHRANRVPLRKCLVGNLHHWGRPLAVRSPRQSKRLWMVEYRSTQTEISKCKR